MVKKQKLCYNMVIMTEGQRNYLADLANKKGVRVDGADAMSQAAASAKIDELKALPDPSFREVSAEEEKLFIKNIAKLNTEINKWQLTRG